MHSAHTISGRCSNCASAGPLDIRFTFAFQPIVDVKSEVIFSYEALVRGLHDESAASILARVNDSNRYRFDQSCRVGAIALAARLGMTANLSINFMPNSVYVPENCIQSTFAAAEKHQFPIEHIIFEVVENDMLTDPGRLVLIMSEYKRFGFLTAIDDFGAGFADLKMLAQFQPSILKIDIALVRDIDRDFARQAIVHGLLQMCRELGVRVLAEGVETLAEYAWLRDAGIDLFQGYLFARPAFEALPEVDFAVLRAFDIERHAELGGEHR